MHRSSIFVFFKKRLLQQTVCEQLYKLFFPNSNEKVKCGYEELKSPEFYYILLYYSQNNDNLRKIYSYLNFRIFCIFSLTPPPQKKKKKKKKTIIKYSLSFLIFCQNAGNIIWFLFLREYTRALWFYLKNSFKKYREIANIACVLIKKY
jgi:hypothetical protein